MNIQYWPICFLLILVGSGCIFILHLSLPNQNQPASVPAPPDLVDDEIAAEYREYLSSPKWKNFQKNQRLAVLVPYRDRACDLAEFLEVLPGYLTDLGIDYEIYVVEQQSGFRFNRGMLLNVGFSLASGHFAPTYIALHDVDMLPLMDTVDYGFTGGVRSLSSCVQQFGWDLPYPRYLGGVILINAQVFHDINGFSNRFWGWGGEDDDLMVRLQLRSTFIHYPNPSCLSALRNTHAKHSPRIADPHANIRLTQSFNHRLNKIDGFQTAHFAVRNHTFDPLLKYHHYQVDLEVGSWVEDAHSG